MVSLPDGAAKAYRHPTRELVHLLLVFNMRLLPMKLPVLLVSLLLVAPTFIQAQQPQVESPECTVMGTTHPYATVRFFQWVHTDDKFMIPDKLALITEVKANDEGRFSVVLAASTYDVLVAEPGYYPKAFRLKVRGKKPCLKPMTLRLRRDKSVHYE